MKLIFGCLEDFIAELKEREIIEARITPKVRSEFGGKIPFTLYTLNVVVTAKLNGTVAECCLYVGRDYEDFLSRKPPEGLVKKQEEMLKQATERLEKSGIKVKPGLWSTEEIEIDAFLSKERS